MSVAWTKAAGVNVEEEDGFHKCSEWGSSGTQAVVRIQGMKEKTKTEADQGPGISETLQILGIQYAPFQRDGLCVIPAGTV